MLRGFLKIAVPCLLLIAVLAAAKYMDSGRYANRTPSDPQSSVPSFDWQETESVETTAAMETEPVQTEPAETEAEQTVSSQQDQTFVFTFLGDCTLGTTPAVYYAQVGFIKTIGEDYLYPFENVAVVEIMGRDAGWLTAASVLARNEYNEAPHLIYLPESDFSTEQFIADIKEQLKQRKQVIVAVSEGIRDANGEYISAKSTKTDQFGHVMLSGNGKYLESLVQKEIGC